MNNRTSPTLTIGIPAHNEEQNIRNMLSSVLKQEGRSFRLEHIYVLCDGCTDATEKMALKIAAEYPIITVLCDGQRKRKSGRMNQLFRMNKSDVVMCLDADIILSSNTVEEMVKALFEEPEVSLVTCRDIPIKLDTFIGRVIHTGFILWDRARVPVNGGDHIQNMRGNTMALTRSFADSISIPATIYNDGGYLYLKAKEQKGFRYAGKAVIFYNAVGTLKDYRLLSIRGIKNERMNLVPYFGDRVYDLCKIPFRYKVRAVFTTFCEQPILVLFSIALGLFVRVIQTEDKLLKTGTWETVQSTKTAIKL